MMNSKVTLKDVAKSANVDPSTVSRHLNGKKTFDIETVERIELAVKELGYRPNRIGKILRQGRSKLIGVVVPDITHQNYALAIESIQHACRKEGLGMLLFTTGYDYEEEKSALRQLIDLNVDGVILNLASHSVHRHQAWWPEQLPKVLLFNDGELEGLPSIALNNRQAMLSLTEHLIERGHQNIAMIGSDFTRVHRYKMRAEGYREAMQKAGLAEQIQIEETQLGLEDLSSVLCRILSVKHRPTAIISSHAQLLIKLHGELNQMEYRIPQDISLAGFNLYEMGKLLSPTICTVDQSISQIGEQTLALLKQQIDGEASSERYYVSSDFSYGQSIKVLQPS
ncbi:LacI family transcriptional regulator [Photobacterium makurazakiensis]